MTTPPRLQEVVGEFPMVPNDSVANGADIGVGTHLAEAINKGNRDSTIEDIVAKAGASSLFELAATFSEEKMKKIFSIAMAGYHKSQQSNLSTQDQSNPNKRNKEGEHPNSMQVDEVTTYETITDEDIAKMECEEDDEDYSLGREEMRKINKKQKKLAKANSPSPPGTSSQFLQCTGTLFSSQSQSIHLCCRI